MILYCKQNDTMSSVNTGLRWRLLFISNRRSVMNQQGMSILHKVLPAALNADIISKKEPLVKAPEPVVKAPEPLVKAPEPVVKAPEPLVEYKNYCTFNNPCSMYNRCDLCADYYKKMN